MNRAQLEPSNAPSQLLQNWNPKIKFTQQGVPQREKHGLHLWTHTAFYSQGPKAQQAMS
ncbi:MAG: hypothetical protein AAFN10_20965 [Bacteroidota bacterium]